MVITKSGLLFTATLGLLLVFLLLATQIVSSSKTGPTSQVPNLQVATPGSTNTMLPTVISTYKPMLTPMPTRNTLGNDWIPLQLDADAVAQWSNYAQSVTPQPDISSAEQIPLYPKAQQIRSKESTLQHQPPQLEFDTQTSAQDVMAFYKVVLTKSGWKVVEEVSRESFARLRFVWSDPTNFSSCELHFQVRAEAPGNWEIHKTESPAHVYIVLEKIPLASKPPIYPGAQQLEVKNVTAADSYNDRVTTYLIDAKPAEIEQYYMTTLAKCGWNYGNYLGKEVRNLGTIAEGLVFVFGSGGPEGAWSGWLTVQAKEQDGGLTRVELHARGTDISAPQP